ncbi:MAG TPA: NUDIX domain-containing protein [Thermoanaerobaculia bacterium]|jgi:8-oxo-dGTP pyrophosphatase MutT (NUDIX family)|nr:NUDIX domain-containing protein [Thermoanaerobaculia bacterium]
MSRHQSLLDELRHYAPADALEGAHHAALLELLTRGDAVFTRGHFDPGHVTASCYVVDGDARLLLHRHRRLGRWLQMGGHLEGDELPSRAALREAEEESGLNSLQLVVERIFDLDVHPIPAGKGEPEHRPFDVRYLARTATPERIAIDPNESEDLAWTDLGRAAELLDEEAGWRVIRKIRSVV